MKRILYLLFLLFLTHATYAQNNMSKYAVEGKRYLTQYWRQPELYLEHQAYYIIDKVSESLQANRPSAQVNRERAMALLLLDALFHEPNPGEIAAVKEFMASQVALVLEDFKKPLPDKETLRIYKLYNCSMLFRTQDITVAVDLDGWGGVLIPDDLMEKIVENIDVLFISHNHGDHYDIHVRDLCHKLNVPIYGTEGVFADDPAVNHVRFADPQKMSVDLPEGHLDVHVLPGHQEDIQNNIWLVTFPNKKVVCATGDQWRRDKSDLEWLNDIHKSLPPIDVLAIDCWIHDYSAHVSAFSPKMIVSQHENELGHRLDHREAYWLTMFKNDEVHKVTVPYILMAWGEWYDYK